MPIGEALGDGAGGPAKKPSQIPSQAPSAATITAATDAASFPPHFLHQGEGSSTGELEVSRAPKTRIRAACSAGLRLPRWRVSAMPSPFMIPVTDALSIPGEETRRSRTLMFPMSESASAFAKASVRDAWLCLSCSVSWERFSRVLAAFALAAERSSGVRGGGVMLDCTCFPTRNCVAGGATHQSIALGVAASLQHAHFGMTERHEPHRLSASACVGGVAVTLPAAQRRDCARKSAAA